jgi:hypothetical protein
MQYWFIGFIFNSKLELVMLHIVMYLSYKNLNSYYWQEKKQILRLIYGITLVTK